MFDFRQYSRLPAHLPWLAYDPDSQTFLMDGNYLGFTISALPLPGVSTGDGLPARERGLV